MMKLCPKCGGDICLDEPVESGLLKMLPYGDATWAGKPVPLTKAQSALLYTLLKAGGAPVSRQALADRMGCETDDPNSVINTQVCLMRRKFARMGVDVPVRIVRGVGLRWAA